MSDEDKKLGDGSDKKDEVKAPIKKRSPNRLIVDEASIDLPFTMNLHAGWAWEIEFFHFLRSFEGDYLNDHNSPAFNSAEGVAALNKMKEVADVCMGAEGLTYSVDDSEIGMQVGSLAFVQLWASRAANMDDPEKSDFVDGIGFAPAAAPNPDCWVTRVSNTSSTNPMASSCKQN